VAVVRYGEVVHDAVPRLAGRAAEEHQQRGAEGLEIGVARQELAAAHVVEELDAEHGEHEEE